jgi:tape measure domain-containing protein
MTIKVDVKLDDKKFSDGAKKIKKEAKGIQESLGGIAIAAGAAFAGFGASVATAVSQASKFEDIGVQFRVLTGDAEKASEVVRGLTDFAARTPFQFEGVAESGKQLLAFGFTTEELTDRLREIGDVAAASGTDFQDLSLIFGQVRAAGKLTGERLLQLQERGIPVLEGLAKNLGTTQAAVRELVSKGKIDFETFQKAFASLSEEGGFAFGGLDALSKTFAGSLSTLKDNFTFLLAEIGKQFLPILTELAQKLTEVIQFLREHQVVSQFAAAFLAIGTVVAGAVTALAAGAIALNQITSAFAIAKTAALAFAGSAKIAVGATGIGLLILAGQLLVENWSTVWPAAQEIFIEFVTTVSELASAVGNVILSLFTFDPDKISESFDAASALVQEKMAAMAESVAIQFEEQEVKPIDTMVPKPEEITERSIAARDALAIEQESTTAMMAAAEKRRQDLLLNQKKAANKATQEEEKQNKTILQQIDDIANSRKVKAAESAFGELAKLTASKNAELKAIGKAAAVAGITIDTAQAAIKVFKNFQEFIPFPPISIPLGIAAAGAVIAFGAEQISTVLAAQDGGIVTGGIPGKDSVPALLAPGELVVPEQNFDQVVGAVAAAQVGEEAPGGTAGEATIEISLRDDAIEFIEAQLIERRNLNITQELV